MKQRKKKVQTFWVLKMPNGLFQCDIVGELWIFTNKSKTAHAKWQGDGIKWVKIKLVEIKDKR